MVCRLNAMTAHGLACAKSCASLLQRVNAATALVTIPVAWLDPDLRVFSPDEFVKYEGAGQ
jgi:hypothetical protein